MYTSARIAMEILGGGEAHVGSPREEYEEFTPDLPPRIQRWRFNKWHIRYYCKMMFDVHRTTQILVAVFKIIKTQRTIIIISIRWLIVFNSRREAVNFSTTTTPFGIDIYCC